MKRRLLSVALMLSMALSMLPVTVWAAEDTEESDAAVEEVQVLIDALPAVEEIRVMDPDDRRSAYDQIQAAYDTYRALTDEQRALLTGAEVFEELFAFFNGQIMPLAAIPVFYVNAQGQLQGSVSASEVENDTDTWNESWYVVDSNVTISSRITVSGAINLILADGYTLTASKGIHVTGGSSLTIWGQTDGNGALTATGGNHQAGIGGNEGQSCGPITINGGKVTAAGGSGGAGIGGGYEGNGSNITINGGSVTATGGSQGAGIGGGYRDNYENSSIGNGVNIIITGGTVVANGGIEAAGIGGGKDGNGTDITISGGDVTATGGAGSSGETGSGGSGIGGGSGGTVTDGGNGKNITISGGKVTAKGGAGGAGIGGGRAGSSDGIKIQGGTVEATGGAGAAGIGGGNGTLYGGGNGDGIEITGGDVTVAGGAGAAGIGGGSGDTTSSGSIDGDAVIHAEGGVSGSVNKKQGIIFEDNNGTVYGDVTIDGELTIDNDENLTVPEDSSLTNNGTLTNHGQLNVEDGGTLNNSGTIDNTDGEIYQEGAIHDNGEITGHQPIPAAFYYDPASDSSKEATDIVAVQAADTQWTVESGWYVVKEPVTLSSGVQVSGDVNLILVNGKNLNIPGGIQVEESGSLTIWGQSKQTGSLTAAVISGGGITINGGNVTATSGSGASGISGSITIHGGVVTASGEPAMSTAPEFGSYSHLTFGNEGTAEAANLPVEWSGNPNGTWPWKWVRIQPMDGPKGLTVTSNPSGAVLDGSADKTITLTAKIVFTINGEDREFDVSDDVQWELTGMVEAGTGISGHILTIDANESGAELIVTARYGDQDDTIRVYVSRGMTVNYYNPVSGRSTTAEVIAPANDYWTDQNASGGWYVARGEVSFNYVTVSGRVNLILEDGSTLQANGGISIRDGGSLTIWGQNADYNADGSLIANANSNWMAAGIGSSGFGGSGVNITINGGHITAVGGEDMGAGIGSGGYGEGNTNITINGGIVKAAGGNRAAGIGAGESYYNSSINITITGGVVEAAGGRGANGIGGYSRYPDTAGIGITITGGTVTAKGGVQDWYGDEESIPAIGAAPAFGGYVHGTYGNADDDSETTDLVEWTGKADSSWSWHWVKIQPMTRNLIITPRPVTLKVGETVTLTVTVDAELADGNPLPAIRNPERVTAGIAPKESAEIRTNGNTITLTARQAGTATLTVSTSGQTPPCTGTVAVTIAKAASGSANGGVRPSVQAPADSNNEQPPEGGADSPSLAFSDLDSSAWYREAVDYVISRGLMSGYGDGKFGPNDTLSRAMLAQILYNAAGGIPVNYLMQYDDVPAGAWYTEAVRWAASEGIVSGYGNGVFGSNDPITREQFAVMLYRFAQSQGSGFTGNWMFLLDYTDMHGISDYAYEAVAWCVMNGVMSGYEDGTLRPQGNATRAEAASMLMRFLASPTGT